MSKKREWFKWKLRSGRRGTLRRAALRAGNGFETMGACVAMLDHARGESHWIDNPEGVFKSTVSDLAIDYSTPEHRVREVLGALVATGWLSVSRDIAVAEADEDLHFRVIRYLAFNDPQGSDADRKAAERDRNSTLEKVDLLRQLLVNDTDPEYFTKNMLLQGSVTGGHEPSAMSLEGEGEGEESKELSSKSSKPTVDPTHIRTIFDHWAEQTYTGRGPRPKLDTKRRTRIAARLREGFTTDDLKSVVDGFLKSPWHNGTESGKRYLGIDTIYRDAAQVEKGIELATGKPIPLRTTTGPATDPSFNQGDLANYRGETA